MQTLLKDHSGRTIGFLRDVSPYRREVLSRSAQVAGWFNPKFGPNGATFDTGGVKIGEGDLRAALVDFSRD